MNMSCKDGSAKDNTCQACWCIRRCRCPPGWAGFNCTVCQNDGSRTHYPVNTTNVTYPDASRCQTGFRSVSANHSTHATCKLGGALPQFLTGVESAIVSSFMYEPKDIGTVEVAVWRVTPFCADPMLMQCLATHCELVQPGTTGCGLGKVCMKCAKSSCKMGRLQFPETDLSFMTQILKQFTGPSMFACEDQTNPNITAYQGSCSWNSDDFPLAITLVECVTGYVGGRGGYGKEVYVYSSIVCEVKVAK